MKRSKAVVAAVTCLLMMFTLTGCGTSNPYKSVDFSKYIKLGEYKGLEVEKFTVKVTDKDVSERIKENLAEKEKQVDSTEGKVKDGDTVNIDYVGKIDGKEFDGGTAEGASLTIGSGQFIDGFESGLIGVKIGDTKDLKLKFPDDYSNSDVAGKDVVFTVTVNSKKVTQTPKLDEDFVKENSDCETVDEYKAYIKKQLKKEKTQEGEDTQKDYLWSKIVESTEVLKDDDGNEKYPEDRVDEVVDQTMTMYEDYAEQNNLELADFLEQQMGMSEDEFKKELKSQAQATVKDEMVLYAIAEKEDITVSSDDYDKFVKDTLKQYGYDDEESFEEIAGQSFEEAYGGEENVTTAVYREKVLDFILDNAKVVDKISTKKS